MGLPKPYYNDERAGIQIYLGDCREILPLLPKADLILTDPPYGEKNNCDYTRFTGGQRTNSRMRAGKTHGNIHDDHLKFDLSLLPESNVSIIWGANNFFDMLGKGALLVWDKKSDGLEGKFMSDAEVAWFSRGCGVFIFRHKWDGFNRASERNVFLHPTQKPVELMEFCIQRSRTAGLILDPFCGSGSTLRAAKDLGRKAIGIEIEERYCEIAAKRLQQEVFDFSDDKKSA